jgi:nucleoside-diphosphate-sugar epimerase
VDFGGRYQDFPQDGDARSRSEACLKQRVGRLVRCRRRRLFFDGRDHLKTENKCQTLQEASYAATKYLAEQGIRRQNFGSVLALRPRLSGAGDEHFSRAC